MADTKTKTEDAKDDVQKVEVVNNGKPTVEGDGKQLSADEARNSGEEVESNHNTSEPAKPIRTAQLEAMNDYNPQRRAPNKANIKSDTVEGKKEAFDRVEDKGTRKSAAEMERDGDYRFGEKLSGEMSETAKTAAYGRAETKPEGWNETQAKVDKANNAASPGERKAPPAGTSKK